MTHNPFFGEPLVRVALIEDSPFGLFPRGRFEVNASENTVTYQPADGDSCMCVKGVLIGRDFHWSKSCEFDYAGVIQIIKEGKHTLLLNVLKAERYLESVVGSEMHPQAPLEFAKAHAVIARSWLIRQMNRKPQAAAEKAQTTGRHITWTESSAHTGFDVCCDDHCQRYQGLGSVSEISRQAVAATCGLVLTDSDGEIADARYSKCCGGRTELFSTCWADTDYSYLTSVECPYCHPDRLHAALQKHSTLLKDYDALTADYYRWHREVSAAEVVANLKTRFGIGVGEILELVPLKAGPSGRVSELSVKGTKGEAVIGKELSIRRLLSPSHLYSSAFSVSKEGDSFHLHGRGWGHGVGMCQIGAAVMSVEGASCEEILSYYYPGTTLVRLYD